jgi:membrane protein implicated in regulation of membrane protease activity
MNGWESLYQISGVQSIVDLPSGDLRSLLGLNFLILAGVLMLLALVIIAVEYSAHLSPGPFETALILLSLLGGVLGILFRGQVKKEASSGTV